jgi:DNA-binding NtrC family response regulator
MDLLSVPWLSQMGDRVLIVEPVTAIASAIAGLLERHGCRVVVSRSAADACLYPRRFDCGVFSDRLPDAGGIALAGWLLAEERVRVAVMFGHDTDTAMRLRASNLGTYVHRSSGVDVLGRAVLDAIGDTRRAIAVGAELEGGNFRMEARTGPRRRL